MQTKIIRKTDERQENPFTKIMVVTQMGTQRSIYIFMR